jgi:hypothetical protein
MGTEIEHVDRSTIHSAYPNLQIEFGRCDVVKSGHKYLQILATRSETALLFLSFAISVVAAAVSIAPAQGVESKKNDHSNSQANMRIDKPVKPVALKTLRVTDPKAIDRRRTQVLLV